MFAQVFVVRLATRALYNGAKEYVAAVAVGFARTGLEQQRIVLKKLQIIVYRTNIGVMRHEAFVPERADS